MEMVSWVKFKLDWVLQEPFTETQGLRGSSPEAVTSKLSPEE